MCSSMRREFGLAGDWCGQASQVVLPPSLLLSSSVELLPVLGREGISQRRMNAAVGARDRLGANPLDDVQRRQQNGLAAQALHQRGGQHDALVGLQR